MTLLSVERVTKRFGGVVANREISFDVAPGRMTGFVGANDGGSSTGFLLEMARVLSARRHKNDIFLVWFDGEEAVGQWSDRDGVYGSRHLAEKWASDGRLGIVVLIEGGDSITSPDRLGEWWDRIRLLPTDT